MSLAQFLEKITNNQSISFDETMTIINSNYDYQPSKFSNGLGEHKIINNAGSNEGSCKIFAFAQLHQLNQQQTLNLFGDYYHQDVLQDPNGTGHQNIRNFMRDGWEGIEFSSQPLQAK